VGSDDVTGAALAVRHLIDLGHRRIAFVGSSSRPVSSERRRQGYAAVLQEQGLPARAEWAIAPPAGEDIDAGRLSLAALLPFAPTAILAYNDVTAVGILLEARDRGMSIPGQLSVVGFDDIELTRYVTPALTTVNQPKQAMGQAAVDKVLSLLAGQETQDLVLPCHLVVRQSTAPPATA
jgi:LacI family transcriptional regulator